MEDDGDVVERYEYDVYGKCTIYEPDFSDTRSTSGYNNVIMFTGQRFDRLDSGDLQLMYYKNRYYCTNTGRFLQRDPIEYEDSMNLYQYVISNPLSNLDPYGKLCEDKCSPGSAKILDKQLVLFSRDSDHEVHSEPFSGEDYFDEGMRRIFEYIEEEGELDSNVVEAFQSFAEAYSAVTMGFDVYIRIYYDCCLRKKCTKGTISRKITNVVNWITRRPQIKGDCFYYDWDDEQHVRLTQVERVKPKSDEPDPRGFNSASIHPGMRKKDLKNKIEFLENRANSDCRHRWMTGRRLPKIPAHK